MFQVGSRFIRLQDLDSGPSYLGCVVVAPIGRPDGQPPVLLVLLTHVAGLVPHAVAVPHPGPQHIADPRGMFAGAPSLQHQECHHCSITAVCLT